MHLDWVWVLSFEFSCCSIDCISFVCGAILFPHFSHVYSGTKEFPEVFQLAQPLFNDTPCNRAYEFLLECQDHLCNLAILETHGVAITSYQFTSLDKEWWRLMVACRPMRSPAMSYEQLPEICLRDSCPIASEIAAEMSLIGYSRNICLFLTKRIDFTHYIDMLCLALLLSSRQSDGFPRAWWGIFKRLQLSWCWLEYFPKCCGSRSYRAY